MKLAVCSELLADRPFAEACATIAAQGFAGVEIAPYKLAHDPHSLGARGVAALRRIVEDAGLSFVGLHWLLAGPKLLHVCHPDPGVRRRSWESLHRLADLCGELGGGVMVLGSGRQRDALGIDATEALGHLQDGLAHLAPWAHAAACVVLIEALPARITRVINTLDQASALVRAVAQPGLAGMFDFHNCEDENLSWAELLERHLGMIRHVHLNDPQGGHLCLRRLGQAEIQAYRAAFRTLSDGAYDGWVSLEVFRFDLPPEQVLSETYRALERLAEPARAGAADA